MLWLAQYLHNLRRQQIGRRQRLSIFHHLNKELVLNSMFNTMNGASTLSRLLIRYNINK
jgi:hypothetical protein